MAQFPLAGSQGRVGGFCFRVPLGLQWCGSEPCGDTLGDPGGGGRGTGCASSSSDGAGGRDGEEELRDDLLCVLYVDTLAHTNWR